MSIHLWGDFLLDYSGRCLPLGSSFSAKTPRTGFETALKILEQASKAHDFPNEVRFFSKTLMLVKYRNLMHYHGCILFLIFPEQGQQFFLGKQLPVHISALPPVRSQLESFQVIRYHVSLLSMQGSKFYVFGQVLVDVSNAPTRASNMIQAIFSSDRVISFRM